MPTSTEQTSTEPTSTEHDAFIQAQPEIVWSFLTDPKRLIRWKGRLAALDPRPGGEFHVEFAPGRTVSGEYLEIDPYRRVVFSWGWDGPESPVPPGSSRVEITLAPEGAGTRLHLVHSELPVAEVVTHAEGWIHYFARLVTVAEGGDPGQDPWSAPFDEARSKAERPQAPPEGTPVVSERKSR